METAPEGDWSSRAPRTVLRKISNSGDSQGESPERKSAIRIVAAPIGANEARSVKSERGRAIAARPRRSRSRAHCGKECPGWEIRRVARILGHARTASGSLDDARGMTRRNHGTHSWSCTASQFADGGTGLGEVPFAWGKTLSFRCGSPAPDLPAALPSDARCELAVSAITKITATVRREASVRETPLHSARHDRDKNSSLWVSRATTDFYRTIAARCCRRARRTISRPAVRRDRITWSCMQEWSKWACTGKFGFFSRN